jgi:hypothetical protein
MSNPKADYQRRNDQLNKALNLDLPYRVLLGVTGDHFFSTRLAGMSNAEAMRDHKGRYAAVKACVLRFGLEYAFETGIYPSQWMESIGSRHYKWPGHNLSDDMTFQFVEKDYMRADEYDKFLADPEAFILRVVWSRMAERLEPLSDFPSLLGLGVDPIYSGAAFESDGIQSALAALQQLGSETRTANQAQASYTAEMEDLGFPMIYEASFTPPFDTVADFLRGLRGVMLDMFRTPDKLIAAADLFVQPQIDSAVAWAKATATPRVMMWLHRGAAGFMSNEQYERFYWPSLQKVILGIVDQGITPILFCQGDYTPRLPFLAQLPRGKVAIHFDQIDRQKAQAALADRQCLWVPVPAGQLVTGTPQQVRDDVKSIIDTFAGAGGLIIDGSMGLPDETRPENVTAMVEAVADYGGVR